MYRSRKQLKKTKLTNQYAMARVTGTLKAMGCKTAQTVCSYDSYSAIFKKCTTIQRMASHSV